MLLLVSVMLPGFAAGHILPASAAPQNDAGCHGSGHKSPARPADYRCCQVGHDSAMLQERVLAPAADASIGLVEALQSTPAFAREINLKHNSVLDSGESPGTIPLRI